MHNFDDVAIECVQVVGKLSVGALWVKCISVKSLSLLCSTIDKYNQIQLQQNVYVIHAVTKQFVNSAKIKKTLRLQSLSYVKQNN